MNFKTTHVRLHIRDQNLALAAYERLLENARGANVEVTSPPHDAGIPQIHIQFNIQRPVHVLATIGVKVVQVGNILAITVEKGLTGKYDIYPVDNVFVSDESIITHPSLIEKAKLLIQFAGTYRLRAKWTIQHQPEPEPAYKMGSYKQSSVSTSEHLLNGFVRFRTLPKFQNPRVVNLGKEVPSMLSESDKEQIKRWWEREDQADQLRNTTFDTPQEIKTHEGRYQARDTQLSPSGQVDPLQGDNFQNRSFDHEATLGDGEPSAINWLGGRALAGVPQLMGRLSMGAGAGESATAELETAAGDESYALSANHISYAVFDRPLNGLLVEFNGKTLLLHVNQADVKQNTCRFNVDVNDVAHVTFIKYITTGGVVNLQLQLGKTHKIPGDIIEVEFDENECVLWVTVNTTNATIYNNIAQRFGDMKRRARFPRDAQGNVADVALEETKVLPKAGNSVPTGVEKITKSESNTGSMGIRIQDDKLFVMVGDKEFEETVIQSGDSYFISTKLVKDWDEATLKMVAVVLKANHGGKAKGDIHLSRDDGGLAIILGKKPRFQKLRHALDKVIENQGKDEGVSKTV